MSDEANEKSNKTWLYVTGGLVAFMAAALLSRVGLRRLP